MVPRAERKLAAIMAADVVAYSRLVAADEGVRLPALWRGERRSSSR